MRTEQNNDARDRLIRGTQELLWERGYNGVSPKAIQERAGVGQGSMYHHFKGKRDLALAALELTGESMRTTVGAVLHGEGRAIECLRAYLTGSRDSLRGCPIGRMVQDAEVIGDEGLRRPVSATLNWQIGELAALIAQAQQEGDLDVALDPRETAASMSAMLQGAYVLARAAAHREPFDQAVRGYLALLSTRSEVRS